MIKILFNTSVIIATLFCNAQTDSTAFEGVPQPNTPTAFITVPTPEGSNLRMEGSYTIEAWVYPILSGQSNETFIVETYSPNGFGGFVLRVSNYGTLKVYQIGHPSASEVFALGNVQLFNEQWNHVAMVYDKSNSTLRAVLNGTTDAQVTCTSLTFNFNSEMHIGARGDDQHVWKKTRIDNVRIWDHAKNDAELNQNKNACFNGTEPGLLALYTFEGNTETVLDRTGNGNNGVINNFAPTSYIWGVFDCENILSTDENQKLSAEVFPNPTSENITVKLENTLPARIEITNAVGQVVSTQNVISESETVTLPIGKGIYFVKITQNGNSSIRKVVKQ